MTPRKAALTLVTGASPATREAAVAALLAREPVSELGHCAVLLEGLPSGHSLLVSTNQLQVHRIAPACLCCTGNLVLRVTLNRLLRLRPERIVIGMATWDHLDQLRSWLQAPPYDQLLVLTADLHT